MLYAGSRKPDSHTLNDHSRVVETHKAGDAVSLRSPAVLMHNSSLEPASVLEQYQFTVDA